MNIRVHVAFGSAALLLGAIQVFRTKGDRFHGQTGHWFLKLFSVVITTAILGVFIFEFRPFLLALTFSAAYGCIAGYRVIVLKGKRPQLVDNLISIAGLLFSVIFALSMNAQNYDMPLVTIYATLGGISSYCTYDIARNIVSISWLEATWLHEHIFKMISAFAALLSAASGSLLPTLGATSQLAPIVFGFALIFFFITAIKPRSHHQE